MNEVEFWLFVQQKLKQNIAVALMLVPQSIGSSPGRKGHKMAVAQDAEMRGTIGGGAMEFKQVEFCKKQLVLGTNTPIYQRLKHDRSDKKYWSGLSCSGEQTVLTFFMNVADLPLADSIVEACSKEESYLLSCSPKGLQLEKADTDSLPLEYEFESEASWRYAFILAWRERVYLIGAGHVGLALCQQLFFLNFEIILIDNRAQLPTSDYEQFISKKIICKYKNVAEYVPSTARDYIVIMSFSSALDALILGNLLAKPCRYIGMMASKSKAERVRGQMLAKGYTEKEFERVHTPIGLPIPCKSPAEIAVSVAAELISIRNDE